MSDDIKATGTAEEGVPVVVLTLGACTHKYTAREAMRMSNRLLDAVQEADRAVLAVIEAEAVADHGNHTD